MLGGGTVDHWRAGGQRTAGDRDDTAGGEGVVARAGVVGHGRGSGCGRWRRRRWRLIAEGDEHLAWRQSDVLGVLYDAHLLPLRVVEGNVGVGGRDVYRELRRNRVDHRLHVDGRFVVEG